MTRDYDWFDITRWATTRLVQIRSVSPSRDENVAAEEVVRLLHECGLANVYTESGIAPIPGDAYSRSNAYALRRGQSARTVVLFGHIDTVDTADYGSLEPWALDPDALREREGELSLLPGVAGDLADRPGDWMFGRGCADMKSGVAATIAVMRRLATDPAPPLSTVLLATPDEENESAGILAAIRLLHELKIRHGLAYVGAINTDYTSALYPGDPHRYIYTGSIGKMLPGVFVVGAPAHAGEPFDGIDVNVLLAALIGEVSMNSALCDAVRDDIAPPPVTLRAGDLKSRYDTQLPYTAYFLLNVLTLTRDPGDLLDQLRERAQSALERALRRIDDERREWRARQGDVEPGAGSAHDARVVTYRELYDDTAARLGGERIERELAGEWNRLPPDADKRDRTVRLVECLWRLSGRQGPAAVLFYAPPYYPQVAGATGPLAEAVTEVVAAHPELRLVEREFFPLLSDMSYLRLDPGIDVAGLVENMPVWADRPGGYALPLELIRELDLPVVNIGPYGRGVHQPGERVLMSYSFGMVPQLIWETIEQLSRIDPLRRVP